MYDMELNTMLNFIKMQGAGNDYIYFDCLSSVIGDPENLARRLSKRRFSVGADGIVLILPSKIADAKMRIFNADGSEGMMCGNAIRCVGRWLFESGTVRKSHLKIETESGVRDVYLAIRDKKIGLITVDMGVAGFEKEPFLLNVKGEKYELTAVNVGNNHQVVFLPDIDLLNLDEIGRYFEKNPRFEGGVNTEFCEIVGKNHLKVRVFERGSGETLACGTGACAATIAAILKGECELGKTVKLSMRGGDLFVLCDQTYRVFLTGDAKTVFKGSIEE